MGVEVVVVVVVVSSSSRKDACAVLLVLPHVIKVRCKTPKFTHFMPSHIIVNLVC